VGEGPGELHARELHGDGARFGGADPDREDALTLLLLALALLALVTPPLRRPAYKGLALVGVLYGLAHFVLQGKGWEYQLYPLVLFCCALAPAAVLSWRRADWPRILDLFGDLFGARRPIALAVWALLVVVLGAKGVEALDAPWIAEKARRVAAITRDLGPLVPPGATGGLSTTAQQFTLQQLSSLGPSSYIFLIPATVLLDFFKQESNAKTLAAPKLRVVNNKSASISVGDKQPILLSTTNVLPGQAQTGAVPTTSTVTSIEFKDTGIKLTVEPTVNLIDELTLKLKVEVTRLGDQVTLQASPEIKQFRFGTRTAETILNMRDEETVVLAGLLQDEERKARVTVPVLGDIPILGRLFDSTTQDSVTTEVVLTITTHIVRNIATPNFEAQAFWSGTEATYATTPLFSTEFQDGSLKPVGRPMTVPAPGGTSIQSTAPVTPPVPAGAPAAPQASSQAAPLQPAPQPPTVSPQPALPPPPQAKPDMLARGAGVLAIRPSQLAAAVGQEVAVDLTADQLDSLTESIVSVTYNPQVLEFRRVMDGEMLKRDNVPAAASLSANPAVGQVALHLRRQGAPVSGSGVLARLFFQAKGPGTSPLTIQQATVSGAGGKHVPVTVERAVVVVQ